MFESTKKRTPKNLWQAGIVCLLAVVMLGADASSNTEARFGRIGHNMMCVCSCGQVLLECNHVGCPDSERMRGELQAKLGMSGGDGSGGAGIAGSGTGTTLNDTAILNWFVAKYGATVLAAPIRGGFDNLAWILPIGVFLFGTIGTAFLVRLWAQRRRVLVAAAPAPAPLEDAVRDRIRRETEWQ